jgi:hypothetical protein
LKTGDKKISTGPVLVNQIEAAALTSDSLARGSVIREPIAAQPDYWAGAPGSFFAADEGTWYLTYRLRRPRGVHPDRGGEARIACSTDLVTWHDVWSVTKAQFQTASIERCALQKDHDGRWHYFASFVDPVDGRWCVARLQAGEISQLDPAQAVPLFKAQPLGLEGIKDPWIFEEHRRWHMLLSVALPSRKTTAASHSTLDIYNTGDCLSATGLATSDDLVHWAWQGVIFSPAGPGWDGYCRRLNSIVPFREQYLGFYDGSASHLENYEEKTGLALAPNLREWKSFSPERPWLTSPHASGSLRYLDARFRQRELILFYEFAREDGSHDLRICHCRAGLLDTTLNVLLKLV